MFNKNNVHQRWATRCRSELELSNVHRGRSAPIDPAHEADRINLNDIDAQMQRRKSTCAKRSCSSNSRVISLREELRRIWFSRPKLFFKSPTRVANDETLDDRRGREENEADESVDETSSINSDLEMMPSFFIVDRSLVKPPKNNKMFPFFKK